MKNEPYTSGPTSPETKTCKTNDKNVSEYEF